MFKIIILLVCMTLGLPGSSQSAFFDCSYISAGYGLLGQSYHCYVQNIVRITSLNAAKVISVTGKHKAGYNDDNVEAFHAGTGLIYYFPRDLGKIFKNLKEISIDYTGLKEIHQSDLKDIQNLKNLILSSNNLEILEANLFKFNPNLEYISLSGNRISHIDPHVFDKLTKLTDLHLSENSCIDMSAYNEPEVVPNIIKSARTQCINSDYSNLEHKVRNLEAESSALNSEQLKEKLEKLENLVKNSKFPNYFQDDIEDLKAGLVK